jgi:hypothetical protein
MKNIVYDNRRLHVKYNISMIYPLDHLQTVPASCYDFSVDLYTFCKSDVRGLTTEIVYHLCSYYVMYGPIVHVPSQPMSH